MEVRIVFHNTEKKLLQLDTPTDSIFNRIKYVAFEIQFETLHLKQMQKLHNPTALFKIIRAFLVYFFQADINSVKIRNFYVKGEGGKDG